MRATPGERPVVERSRRVLTILGGTALAALGVTYRLLAGATPFLVYNASASAPVGFYRRADGAPARGDFVLARLPAPVAHFAARRRYLPRSVPLVKRVAAVAGDHVCEQSGVVRINGRGVTVALKRDGARRILTAWDGCRTLAPDEVFLLMPRVRDSFDGRYFGPLPRTDIIERLVPLWTW